MVLARGGSGMNGSELAREADMHHSQISHYINGTNVPYKRTIAKLSEVLGVHIEKRDNSWAIIYDEYNPDRLEELLTEYESRKAARPPSDSERDLLIEFLRSQAESLAKGLDLLAALEDERRRASHDDDS